MTERDSYSKRDFLAGAVLLGGAVLMNGCGRPRVFGAGSDDTTPVTSTELELGFADASRYESADRGPMRQETPLQPPLVETVPYYPGEVVNSIKTGRKIVVLTYDDGPDKVHDLAIANTLDERGYEGKAAFLSVAVNVEANPEVTRELHDRGYTIGNHTYDHSDYSGSGEARQIERAQEAIYAVTGEYSWAFRGAGGTMAQAINAECARLGLVYIWTDGDERDYISPRISADSMNALFARYLHPGYISLRHSGGTHNNTVAATHGMLDIIEKNGYEVMSLLDALSLREDGISSIKPPNMFQRMLSKVNWAPNAGGPIGYDLAADIAAANAAA